MVHARHVSVVTWTGDDGEHNTREDMEPSRPSNEESPFHLDVISCVLVQSFAFALCSLIGKWGCEMFLLKGGG